MIFDVGQQKSNSGGVLLWSNPSPSASFAAQNIELASDDYDMYEIFFKLSINATCVVSIRCIKGFGTALQAITTSSAANQGVWGRRRFVNYVSDSELAFESCYLGYTTQAQTVDNSLAIPLYVIGYKTGVV